MPAVELVEELRHQPKRHALGRRHPQRACEHGIERGGAPGEIPNGALDRCRLLDERRALGGQPIAVALLVEQPEPEPCLQCRDAAHQSRLVDAQGARRGSRAAIAGHGQQKAESVPVEHPRIMRFCRRERQNH
jgi:hypothetical protein